MTAAPLLVVDGVAKKICQDPRRAMFYALRNIVGELLPVQANRELRPGERWAVDNISFELRPGEALAVLGRNGAGKSTLLKLLGGLLKPDRGEVRLTGHAEALIELGAGFNPLLTGRENILLDAARRGLSSRRATGLVDEVADFAEIEDALDQPFRFYSSGMKTRLAYALASRMAPAIFLVDEALAVGDHTFQRKCIRHMHSFLEAGGALLLVSHNIHHIQAVCQRGIVMEHGRQTFAGTAVAAVARHLADRASAPQAGDVQGREHGPLRIDALRAESLAGTAIHSGEAVRVTLHYSAIERIQGSWGFSIWTADEMVCATGEHETQHRTFDPGRGELSCVIPRLPLLPGRYVLRGAIVEQRTHAPLALVGWNSPGVTLDVLAPASAVRNAQAQQGQLVTIDVHWQ